MVVDSNPWGSGYRQLIAWQKFVTRFSTSLSV
jgi:hypothetical protein